MRRASRNARDPSLNTTSARARAVAGRARQSPEPTISRDDPHSRATCPDFLRTSVLPHCRRLACFRHDSRPSFLLPKAIRSGGALQLFVCVTFHVRLDLDPLPIPSPFRPDRDIPSARPSFPSPPSLLCLTSLLLVASLFSSPSSPVHRSVNKSYVYQRDTVTATVPLPALLRLCALSTCCVASG